MADEAVWSKCKACGNVLRPVDKFCRTCGYAVAAQTPAASNRVPQAETAAPMSLFEWLWVLMGFLVLVAGIAAAMQITKAAEDARVATLQASSRLRLLGESTYDWTSFRDLERAAAAAGHGLVWQVVIATVLGTIGCWTVTVVLGWLRRIHDLLDRPRT